MEVISICSQIPVSMFVLTLSDALHKMRSCTCIKPRSRFLLTCIAEVLSTGLLWRMELPSPKIVQHHRRGLGLAASVVLIDGGYSSQATCLRQHHTIRMSTGLQDPRQGQGIGILLFVVQPTLILHAARVTWRSGFVPMHPAGQDPSRPALADPV